MIGRFDEECRVSREVSRAAVSIANDAIDGVDTLLLTEKFVGQWTLTVKLEHVECQLSVSMSRYRVEALRLSAPQRVSLVSPSFPSLLPTLQSRKSSNAATREAIPSRTSFASHRIRATTEANFSLPYPHYFAPTTWRHRNPTEEGLLVAN
jgi:hypothetical protein